MRLDKPTRRAILKTAQDMLDKYENLCQVEYQRIENHQKTIKCSQDLLEHLEAEYVRVKALVVSIQTKIDSDKR